MTETYAEGALLLAPGPVAALTLNAPARRNAMNAAMWSALPALCARVAGDPGIRVLVVSGAGPAAFSAGADIGEFDSVYATPEAARAYNAAVRAGQAALTALPQPTIAAIRGACYGGGVGLALHCDLRIAADTARFAVTPAKLGLAYSPEDSAALVAAVGPARAREMLLTGRTLDAPQALAAGLVHHLHSDDALDAEVAATAQGLAALAPGALAAIKTILDGLAAQSPRAPLQAAFDARFSSAEFREGVAAFREKRPARF
jgi:enoyl-CoA hydratase/carnithine racemase